MNKESLARAITLLGWTFAILFGWLLIELKDRYDDATSFGVGIITIFGATFLMIVWVIYRNIKDNS